MDKIAEATGFWDESNVISAAGVLRKAKLQGKTVSSFRNINGLTSSQEL